MKTRFLSSAKWQLTAVLVALSLHSPVVNAALDGALMDALSTKANNQGSVPVIVSLKSSFNASANLSGAQAASMRSAIGSMQSGVVDTVAAAGTYADNVKTFNNVVPSMALTVDAAGLQALSEDPNVESIQEDIPVPYTLNSAIPAMDFDAVHPYYSGGTGDIAVAILDTGVRETHNWFSGRVLGYLGGCFSTNNSQGASSLCPGGGSSVTGSGTGVNCDPTVLPGCDHGTHVAGIAAGNPATGAKGAAFGAKIIPVQVFSRFDDVNGATNCASNNLGSPCILSYTSDQIAALSYLATDSNVQNFSNLVAANMSLGGGAHSGACDSDSRKPVIDQLRSQGVATVIAAGNSASTNTMGAPACISTAISVCSTEENDTVSSFSDVSAITDLCAVGSSITSAFAHNDSSAGVMGGTSMAAPFVTGAIALMKHRRQRETIDGIEAALKATAVTVADTRTNATHTVLRIDVDDAVASIGVNCSVIPVETLSPSGTIYESSPVFRWTGYSSCALYDFEVKDSLGNQELFFTYTASGAGCNTDTSCEVTYPNTLPDGDYTWTVVGRATTGHSTNPNVPESFSVEPAPVADCTFAPLSTSPSTTLDGPLPTYTWEGYSNCTWYRISVEDNSGNNVSTTWHTASQAGCVSDTSCEVKPGNPLANGNYTWQVQGYNADTFHSPYSAPMGFDVAFFGGCTSAPVSLTPSGTTGQPRPTFTWEGLPACSWYQLTVNDSSGSQVYQTWYTAALASCDADTSCSVMPTSVLLNGSYTWTVQGWSAETLLSPISAVTNLEVDVVGGCTVAPQQVAPSGTVDNPRPVMMWTGLSSCTWYQLSVLDSNGAVAHESWYTAAQVSCDSEGDTACEIKTPILSNGNYTWRVQGWSELTYSSPWSPSTGFEVSASGGCLLAPVAQTPSGSINASRPLFTWDGYSNCTWYQVQVSDANNIVVSQTWHQVAHANCDTDTSCEVSPAMNLFGGNYTWRVQGWNANTAHSPWTAPKSFNVSF